ncbi:MAG: hypothetical protein JW787_16785 [Sedimentisphaerales bacterium]|nr:hypothetical protein [Sedimentisphaerales bacterium]
MVRTFYEQYKKLIPLVGSWASIIALLLIFRPQKEHVNIFYWGLLVISIILVIFSFYFEVKKCGRIHAIHEKDKKKINDYMYNWIVNSGRTAIFSRDMSFACTNKKIKKLLIKKANSCELIVCVPKETDLTKELKENHAEIYYYSEKENINPHTRFTIANYGQGAKERVAVAHGLNEFHMIHEYDKNDPVIYLTKDLINIAMHSSNPKKTE